MLEDCTIAREYVAAYETCLLPINFSQHCESHRSSTALWNLLKGSQPKRKKKSSDLTSSLVSLSLVTLTGIYTETVLGLLQSAGVGSTLFSLHNILLF